MPSSKRSDPIRDSSDGEGRLTARELTELTHRHWPQISSHISDLIVGFLRMNAVVTEGAQRAMSRMDLSPPEFDVLVVLRKTPPPHVLTPSELYRSVLVSPGGITSLLRQLEEKGLVGRETLASDRRVKPVRLTRKGQNRVERSMAEVQRELRGTFESGLSTRQLKAHRDQLYELLDSAEERERTPPE